MEELIAKLKEMLQTLNDTFDIEIDNKQTDSDSGEEVITKLVIANKKNDGAEFLEQFCNLYGCTLEQATGGKMALVYEEGTGLTIRQIK